MRLREWEHHIRKGEKAYCGAKILPFEWAFVDAGHARASVERSDRIQPCPNCLAAARSIVIHTPDGTKAGTMAEVSEIKGHGRFSPFPLQAYLDCTERTDSGAEPPDADGDKQP